MDRGGSGRVKCTRGGARGASPFCVDTRLIIEVLREEERSVSNVPEASIDRHITFGQVNCVAR